MTDNFFEEEGTQFRIIYDSAELKQILNDKFTSKYRPAPYDKSLPSVTSIVGSLSPLDLKSSRGLIKWFMNISKEDYAAQQILNKSSMQKGNDIHKVLEDIMLDEETPVKDKTIDKYLGELEYRDIAEQALTKFPKYKDKAKKSYWENELPIIKPIHSELFIIDSFTKTQGTIDSVCEYNGKLTLLDYKSTNEMNKQTQKYTFPSPKGIKKYHKQLCLYSIFLYNQKYLTKKEFKELQHKILMWHWSREEYRLYEFDNDFIMGYQPEIFKTISWFQKHK